MSKSSDMSSCEWPEPGRDAFLAAEPALAHITDMVGIILAADAMVPWSLVDRLVARFCGPTRDVRGPALNAPEFAAARRALPSATVRDAMMVELRAMDPSAPKYVIATVAPSPSDGRADFGRRIQRAWVDS